MRIDALCFHAYLDSHRLCHSRCRSTFMCFMPILSPTAIGYAESRCRSAFECFLAYPVRQPSAIKKADADRLLNAPTLIFWCPAIGFLESRCRLAFTCC